MKPCILIILSCVWCVAFGFTSKASEEITKADILKTVNHMQQLAAQQKQDLIQAQQDYAIQQDALEKAQEDAVKYNTECAQAEKERDALIWIFAIACGGAALSTFRSALQVISMPWQLIALAGVFAGGFALGFSIGRWALRFLAEFTPHLPF